MDSPPSESERSRRLKRAIQREIDLRIAETIQPLAWSFGGLYAVFAVAHLFNPLLTKPLILVTLASVTSLCCSGLALRVRKHAPRPERSHALETLLATFSLTNCGVHLLLTGDPLQTTNLALVQIAAGFLFLSWLWFAVTTSISVGFFVVAFHASSGGVAWNHFLFMMVSATFASTLIHAFHLAAVRRADKQRLSSDWQTQARLAQLETISHLGHLAATELEPLTLMQTCASAVQRTLEASWVALEQAGDGIQAQVGSRLEVDAHEERVDVSGGDPFGVALVVQLAEPPGFSVAPFLQSVTHLVAMNLRRTTLEKQRLETERALLQAQRMESIALLAGGIAHDFNNLLTVVLGHSDLIRHKRGPHSEDAASLDQVIAAVNVAARLTHQLLAFGRRQPMQSEVFDLREVVAQLQSMLRRTISESVAVDVQLSDEACLVRADRTQMEQVVMNLVVNARDAVDRDGRIQLQTERVELGEPQLRGGRSLAAGSYVVFSVSDDGSGIDTETLPHIFEPFFTTKGSERGTGLGLATVHGIVHQSGGTISVTSAPGMGTTFEVYLPLQEPEEQPTGRSQSVPRPVPVRSATILVVEDNDAVRTFVVAALRDFGYDVIEAASGPDALGASRQYKAPIELLLSDVVMPLMSGTEVARTLRLERQEIKVLFMSGYLGDNIDSDEIVVADSRHALLQKPFTATVLRDAVEEALTGVEVSMRARSAS